MATQTADAVSGFLTRTSAMLIGGERREAASGEAFSVIDPATGDELARVPAGDRPDVDAAVAAARAALPAWRGTPPARRGELLWALRARIEELADELARLETLDNGKPVGEALAVDI